jgi:hypothetical protein
MASAARLLETLGRDGIRVSVTGDKLVVEPASRLTAQTREAIRSQKAELLAALAATCPLADDFDERTALTEVLAGVPREWAEGFATLQAACPPAYVAAWRWQLVVDDAGHFIDRWAAPAAALGWRTLDVFGMHATNPWERLDAAGLVWCIGGADVLAITSYTARLQLRSGATQTFRRNEAEHPEAVAIWTHALSEMPACAKGLK